jgi:hypothetical protein
MKRIIALVAVLAITVTAVAFAGQQAAKGAKAAAHSSAGMKAGTWTGEILDSGCYLSRGAMGTGHAECALKCASQGMPMLLMTKDGKAILLTPNHDNPDAYESLKGMAGSVATVTGTFSERGGVKGIDVTAATAAK